MLNQLGRGLSPMAVLTPTSFRRFTLTNHLPPEITFERDSKATCRNAAGKLIEVGIDEPRFDHTENGVPLGLVIEPEATNKCANYNVNPIDTSDFTDNSLGTISVVDDSAELAAAGLDDICTSGKVYKATATSSSTYIVYIAGNVGNTNAHSISLYARGESGSGTAARLALGGPELDIAPVGENYQQFKHLNLTPNNTSRKFTIAINGNQTLYFILNQLEESTDITSIIPVEGARVTRPTDRVYMDDINDYDWFDEAQGYMTVRHIQRKFTGSDAYIAILNDGGSSDTIGCRLADSGKKLKGYVRANSSSEHSSSNNDVHLESVLSTAGIIWNSTSATILSGGQSNQSSISSPPTGIDHLDIGARNGGAGSMDGWISALEIGRKDLSLYQLGQKLQKPQDDLVMGAGQSLIKGYFNSQEDGADDGKQTLRKIIGEDDRANAFIFLDGSTGSSAACKTSSDANYWWDNATETRGPSFDDFYTEINDVGAKPTAILWGQGEEDSHEMGADTSTSDYKDALKAIFADMRQTLGNIPVYIQIIGRRTDFTNTGGIQAVRDIQKELIAENEWCHAACEVYDLPLHDAVHLSNTGYATAATRNANIMIGTAGSAGPQILNVSRSGAVLTLNITHDAGDDFTPTSSIEGFKFFDNGTEISISGIVKTDNSTLTITLSSTPSASPKILYYGYDDMDGLNIANVIQDNSALSLPLQTAKINVT